MEPQAAKGMDVFLMIRYKKTTILTDAKESSTVLALKHIIEGIMKRPPEEQLLFKDNQLLDEMKTLRECGFTSQVARPEAPATVGLAFRTGDVFEGLEIHPYSPPLDLLDLLRASQNEANEPLFDEDPANEPFSNEDPANEQFFDDEPPNQQFFHNLPNQVLDDDPMCNH
uniref:Ubiquitin-like domain-containing protein n=1 Tax=Mus spicilegus TaxID=10103 RepID=A0A8C6GF75_MUSSI